MRDAQCESAHRNIERIKPCRHADKGERHCVRASEICHEGECEHDNEHDGESCYMFL